METFDTNVIVRLLVEDDPRQSAAALRLWQTALTQGGVFLPKLVLVEAIWVLKVSYQFDRLAIVDVVDALLRTDGVEVEDEELVYASLRDYAAGSADFSDYLILQSARRADALPVHSFDRRFSRHEDVSLIIP